MAISRISQSVVPVFAALLMFGITACGGTDDETTSAPTASASTGENGDPDHPDADHPDAGYIATTTQVTGDNGRVRYDVTVPQVEGGDPAAAAAFNESMRAALQGQIDSSNGDSFTLDSRDESAVAHIGSRVLSGLLVTSWNADPPGAHPTPLVATAVIDVDSAQLITLNTLFPDQQAGLDRLSQESSRLLPATAVGADFDSSGIEPTTQNFTNWVATPAGMQIHFSDYQVGPHAAGLVVVTVPWDRLRDVMAPAMVGVVSS